jgi:cobalamin biosynthesis Mg chelatase CobN
MHGKFFFLGTNPTESTVAVTKEPTTSALNQTGTMSMLQPTTSGRFNPMDEEGSSSDGNSSRTIIVIAVVVAVVLLVILTVVVWWFCERKKRNR